MIDYEVKEYVENTLKVLSIEYEYNDVHYLITPEFIIFRTVDKSVEKYFISFNIDISKKKALKIYFDLQSIFMNDIYFTPYFDCVVKVSQYEVEYFAFGQEARKFYFNEIYEKTELQNSIPDDAVFH